MHIAYARRLAGRVARYLRDRYGARKVLLVGSAVTGMFNPDSSAVTVAFEGVRDGLEEDAPADCRFHFGTRDNGGIERLRIVNLGSISGSERQVLLMESEEV